MFLTLTVDAAGTLSALSRGPLSTFLMLMVGALESPSAPARGPIVDVFNVDGGYSQISVSTHQGACRERFLTLMVGALGTPAAPPRGLTIDVF
jgi:hypothetical protein